MLLRAFLPLLVSCGVLLCPPALAQERAQVRRPATERELGEQRRDRLRGRIRPHTGERLERRRAEIRARRIERVERLLERLERFRSHAQRGRIGELREEARLRRETRHERRPKLPGERRRSL